VILYIVGVLDDGSSFRSGVPTNPRRTLHLTMGVTVQLLVQVLLPSGVVVPLDGIGDGTQRLTLTVRLKPPYDEKLIEQDAVVYPGGEPGQVQFNITAEDWARFQSPGRYLWDIWLADSAHLDPVVPTSPFVVELNVGNPVLVPGT